jgi:hypothetical protein
MINFFLQTHIMGTLFCYAIYVITTQDSDRVYKVGVVHFLRSHMPLWSVTRAPNI